MTSQVTAVDGSVQEIRVSKTSHQRYCGNNTEEESEDDNMLILFSLSLISDDTEAYL